ncbi:CDP-glycerol glycerophosphotransferase family protein [Staphylococcus sp. 17KM0847]|uniref:CDP-glycerol glycerophosphotransferase family protein n=1 Tax=Staphylococcus sp. 17KM0847 TaxID=2583989 RepID=UPI0015DD10C5|nr:CDP-glycerol glycerophosphotransferase family protein [Staphylococcus sp. 17KM0847]QLK85433.1 glycosyltransferase [Staphylococcus sp. 17KM0847]
MKINILGFNIFAKGGTSRSNINLIKSFLDDGHEVNYFNKRDFDSKDIIKLTIHEGLYSKVFNIYSSENFSKLSNGDILIITREDLFIYSQVVKKMNRNIRVVGEIHGPLEYINDDIDLSLDSIDSIRVSTESIKNEFKTKYHFDSVFNHYVNAQHIHIHHKPSNTKRNLLIKARFEDGIKDISYAIKLINYIKNNTNRNDIQLYIKGYGPSETLYKNLVKYYNLSDNVHINTKEPINYIYISTSPYETLGYSILESLAKGNQALVYRGDDNVLEEIYQQYNGIKFLSKDFEEDTQKVLSTLDSKYTREERELDIKNLKLDFVNNNYASTYLDKLSTSLKDIKKSKGNKYKLKKEHVTELHKLNQRKKLYNKLKNKKFFKKILNNNTILTKFHQFYNYKKHKIELKSLDDIVVKNNRVFVESFHGNNFSGDPKYLALKIKERFKDMKVFVSSSNSLVDIEIRNYGFTPVRFGSEAYKKVFRSCKYVVINGNSWDKVFKGKQQIFIQTWHGFPLKKMVSDLNDEKERNQQLSQFLPRMMKWDYLLTSSNIQTMLLKSAFQLEENHKLKILESGAPKNEYLINNNTQEERRRIQSKYLFKYNPQAKYILYCPTWRKGKRTSLTNLNLIKLLDHLPENYEIIVKLHPNESRLRIKYSKLDPRIHCFYNELVDIQELYILSEAMITDYSSTIFDYAHLNKPIFLLQEDTTKYQQEIGFYFDLEEIGSFPVASDDEAQLAKQLNTVKYINYEPLIRTLLNKDTSRSSEMILDTIFQME